VPSPAPDAWANIGEKAPSLQVRSPAIEAWPWSSFHGGAIPFENAVVFLPAAFLARESRLAPQIVGSESVEDKWAESAYFSSHFSSPT
jgi:hypothetical protein